MPPMFSPQSKMELRIAVEACLKLSPKGDCPNGSHGPMGEWDVSGVTDMSGMFSYAASFNADVSKWDVSNVKDMSSMFIGAKSFNCDISKWDVSGVTDMDGMFHGATSFKQNLCGAAWVQSKASKRDMFTSTYGSISRKPCAPRRPIPDREVIQRWRTTPSHISNIGDTTTTVVTTTTAGRSPSADESVTTTTAPTTTTPGPPLLPARI